MTRYNEGNPASDEILLVPQIFVCCEQHLKTGQFDSYQEITVLSTTPTTFFYLGNNIPF